MEQVRGDGKAEREGLAKPIRENEAYEDKDENGEYEGKGLADTMGNHGEVESGWRKVTILLGEGE